MNNNALWAIGIICLTIFALVKAVINRNKPELPSTPMRPDIDFGATQETVIATHAAYYKALEVYYQSFGKKNDDMQPAPPRSKNVI
jgi:hypothetical protein